MTLKLPFAELGLASRVTFEYGGDVSYIERNGSKKTKLSLVTGLTSLFVRLSVSELSVFVILIRFYSVCLMVSRKNIGRLHTGESCINFGCKVLLFIQNIKYLNWLQLVNYNITLHDKTYLCTYLPFNISMYTAHCIQSQSLSPSI